MFLAAAQGIRMGQAVDGDHTRGSGDGQETESWQQRSLEKIASNILIIMRGCYLLYTGMWTVYSNLPPSGRWAAPSLLMDTI